MSDFRCPRCGSRRIHGDLISAGLGVLGRDDYFLTCLDCKDYSPHSRHSLEEAMTMWKALVKAENEVGEESSPAIEVEPCPFCGQPPMVSLSLPESEVRCERDGCGVNPVARGSSIEEAVDAWNMRLG